MLIGYDASRAFASEATGTENYSLNLLRALSKIDRKNRYRVYLRVSEVSKVPRVSNALRKKTHGILDTRDTLDTLQNWPKNFEFKVVRPYRLWTQVGLALETWRNPVDLLFVPAHTLPVLRRRALWVPSVPRVSKAKLQEDRALGTRDTLEARDTRYVVTIHDLGVEYLPGYHQFPQRYYLDLASRYAARQADALIAVSALTKRDLVKRYHVNPRKVFVVGEGVDRHFFRPRPEKEIKNVKIKYKIDGNYILFVGTVQPRKNLEMLIEAFSLLVHSSQLTVDSKKKTVNRELLTVNLQLIIAGKLGWDYDEILSAPEKYGVKERVKFIGYVSGGDLTALYSGAMVLAAPSLFEGFDLPILEALSCGCPAVASDIPPHREILDKISNFKFQISNFDKVAEAMILVKPDDIEEWVQVLYQYISQYEKSKPFTSFQKQLASKFSWEEAAKSTLAVFERVLG